MSSPWNRFRNLCRYYADCVKYSEKSQEYLFPDQLGKSFLMPRLPCGWHRREDEFEVDTAPDDKFVRSVLLKASDEEELFIGYPLNAFISPTGVECLCPIMLFPVTIKVRGVGYTTGMRMQIDRQGVSVNQEWIEYHVPKCDQKAFQRACEQANDELGCIDAELVLNYIALHFKTTEFSPDALAFSVRRSQSKAGLLNTAILFAGNKTTYTKNLIAELRQIRDAPDAVLDKTALAYVFRDPPLPNKPEADNEAVERRIPVSFTKEGMNAGQFEAVEEALNKPFVKVTGPPGTGKSFMSVNLIANEVLNGGSVLFTSKNHKAIHAIVKKVESINDKDFPLVTFCTTEGNPTNADWRKSQDDVGARVGRANARLTGIGFTGKPDGVNENPASMPSSASLEVALSLYRDAEEGIRRYQALRERTSRLSQLVEYLDEQTKNICPEMRDSPEFITLLVQIEAALREERPNSFWKRALVALHWKLFTNRSNRDIARRHLHEFAPQLANAVVSRRTVRKEARRILDVLKYRQIVRAWERAELDAIRCKRDVCDYEMLKSATKTALFDSARYAKDAYVERLTRRILAVEEVDSLVAKCKDSSQRIASLPFMTLVDDGECYGKAVADFRQYLDIFPAWAATMLSLHRASPCLPSVFDLAIIDEASQCDIPPMVPVLFRAKRVAVVGDPDQFPPVITLKETRDKLFRRKYGVDTPKCRKFAFAEGNAFSVVPGASHLLNEHFRCADGIADYFNESFYEGCLTLCCETGRDGRSAIRGLKPGMVWTDAPGGDDAEMEAVLEQLKMLKRDGFKGTIGVISPLRGVANRLKTLLFNHRGEIPEGLDIQNCVNTANGFQGGECDVILFLLGLNNDRAHGEEWYITAKENKYIFNVSVSRAKTLFVAFGDRKRIAVCGLPYIQKLIPENRPPRNPKVGPGEHVLSAALNRAGIQYEAQYPIAGRYLDLAIPSLRLDIEVDGQAWHLDRNGCRKADDIHRDILLETLGWHVIRFWHHEIASDVAECVTRIKAAMATKDEIKP